MMASRLLEEHASIGTYLIRAICAIREQFVVVTIILHRMIARRPAGLGAKQPPEPGETPLRSWQMMHDVFGYYRFVSNYPEQV